MQLHPLPRKLAEAPLHKAAGGPPSTGRAPAPRRRPVSAAASAGQAEAPLGAASRATRCMVAGDEAGAEQLWQQLQGLRQAGAAPDTSSFFEALQGLLRHEEASVASELSGALTPQRSTGSWGEPEQQLQHAGPYKRAYDGIVNVLAGGAWAVRGHGEPAVQEGPRFSTWEEARGGGRKKAAAAPETELYRILGVPRTASAQEIRAAYRQRALQIHPDVSSAPDSAARFTELSQAFDVLYDPELRAAYDEGGSSGLERHQARARAGPARSHAQEAWAEFRPYKRENKRTRARGASAAAGAAAGAGQEGASEGGEAGARPAQVGDVVEYPLRDIELAAEAGAGGGGRVRGVGLLVGRNKDRGDAARLAPDKLELCEVEPLRPLGGRGAWAPDELGAPAFPRLQELRVVPVASFDRRHDQWTIEPGALSEGCAGPPEEEEIML